MGEAAEESKVRAIDLPILVQADADHAYLALTMTHA